MTVNKLFRRSSEAAVNYDYTDFSSGIGYVIFYGAKDAAGNYFLTDNVVYSDTIGENADADTSTYTKVIDLDFDLSAFNLPKYVKGTAIVNVPCGVYNDNGTTTMYPVVNIKHYDGSTETSIGTGSGTNAKLQETSGGTGDEKMFCISVDLTEKHFKIGDVLRVTVEIWGKETAAGVVSLGYDPQNRALAFSTSQGDMALTQLAAHIPFRIDI